MYTPADGRGGTRVSYNAFIGVIWAGTVISLLFVVFRIAVRIKVFRKVYVDDCLVIGAWLLLLANTIIWHTQFSLLNELYHGDESGILPSASTIARFLISVKLNQVTLISFYTCLWFIKLSFLIFFRRLGLRVKGFKIWWWIVLGVSIASFLACIGDAQWECDHGGEIQLVAVCDSPSAVNFQWTTLHVNCALDIITDVMLITIPVLLLWNVKITMRQKLALLAIFSLTIVTSIASIIRVTIVSVNGQVNVLWLGLWGNIEMSISVIVVCLASFRQLFVKQNNNPHAKLQASAESLTFWRRSLLSLTRKLESSNPSTFGSKTKNSVAQRTSVESSSSEYTVPVLLQSIHIKTNVQFGSKPADPMSEHLDSRKLMSPYHGERQTNSYTEIRG